jgi:hypothetical protein
MNDSGEQEQKTASKEKRQFVEGVDYIFENGLMVLTRSFLLERGFCCESGCRNCPYGFRKQELE